MFSELVEAVRLEAKGAEKQRRQMARILTPSHIEYLKKHRDAGRRFDDQDRLAARAKGAEGARKAGNYPAASNVGGKTFNRFFRGRKPTRMPPTSTTNLFKKRTAR